MVGHNSSTGNFKQFTYTQLYDTIIHVKALFMLICACARLFQHYRISLSTLQHLDNGTFLPSQRVL